MRCRTGLQRAERLAQVHERGHGVDVSVGHHGGVEVVVTAAGADVIIVVYPAQGLGGDDAAGYAADKVLAGVFRAAQLQTIGCSLK